MRALEDFHDRTPSRSLIWITFGEDERSAGSTVFSFLIMGRPSTESRFSQRTIQNFKIEPQVIGVEERMPELIGEEVHVLLGRLRGIAQISCRSAFADRRCPPLTVGGSPAADLCRIRYAVSEPPCDRGVGRSTEIVGVRH